MRKLTVGFTFIFISLLALDAYPGLRGGAGWRWPYALPDHAGPVIALGLLILAYLAAITLLQRVNPPAWGVLCGLVLAASILGVAVVGVRGDPAFLLFTRTVSPVQVGANPLAVSYFADGNLQTALDRWPSVMRESLDINLIHFSTSPPGQPLLHYALARGFDRLDGISQPLSMLLRPYQCSNPDIMRYSRGEMVSNLFGVLMPLWAALAVIPIYASARMLTQDRAVALRLVLWWPLIPVVLLFLPVWNSIYPMLVVTVFAFLLAGLRRGRGLWFAGLCTTSGVVMSITTFLNFAVLPVVLFFGLFTLGYSLFTDLQAKNIIARFFFAVRAGIWFGLGLSSLWILFFLAAGHTPFELLRISFELHDQLVQNDYLPWVILHPYDVLMFAGWPVAVLFLISVLRSAASARKRSIDATGVLALSMFLTFAAVNFAGVAQGETARILSYYVPFFLLSAGLLYHDRARNWDIPLLAAQGVTVLVMATVLPVVPLDLNPQPEAPLTGFFTFEDMEPQPINAIFTSDRFAGSFTLAAQRFVADLSARAITLETIWRGGEQAERPYLFEVVAYAQNEVDGEIVTEPFRWPAQFGNYLPTCWRTEDQIHDIIVLDMPTISAPVIWTLELRAVDERTGDVMTVMQDGEIRNGALLGPVNYP